MLDASDMATELPPESDEDRFDAITAEVRRVAYHKQVDGLRLLVEALRIERSTMARLSAPREWEADSSISAVVHEALRRLLAKKLPYPDRSMR